MKLNEVVREAEYIDIILSLLDKPYHISSVTKMVFLSFCICHESNFSFYKNRTKDFVDVFFQNISLKLSLDYKDIERIMSVLDMLVKTDTINIKEDKIEIRKEIDHNSENAFMKMCASKIPNPILEIDKLDSVAVIEEVIRYV